MKNQIADQIKLLEKMLGDESLQSIVDSVILELTKALSKGLPLLVFGNGGSAADALHISGELVGKFYADRKSLNVICLSSNPILITAWSNDVNYDSVFERQIQAHGCTGGLAWGISTSGNSKSVILGLQAARELGMITIGMTGNTKGAILQHCDFLIEVPTNQTPRVQELHIPIYHFICQEVEKNISAKNII
jgi:D-sedoheptulose 7-phosphate isomerase